MDGFTLASSLQPALRSPWTDMEGTLANANAGVWSWSGKFSSSLLCDPLTLETRSRVHLDDLDLRQEPSRCEAKLPPHPIPHCPQNTDGISEGVVVPDD